MENIRMFIHFIGGTASLFLLSVMFVFFLGLGSNDSFVGDYLYWVGHNLWTVIIAIPITALYMGYLHKQDKKQQKEEKFKQGEYAKWLH